MTRLYLVGLETLYKHCHDRQEKIRRFVLDEVKYRLMSYMHLDFLEPDFYTFTHRFHDSMMIDSGAFSWLKKNKGDPVKGVNIWDYAYEYCEWLSENRNYIDHYVELDLAKEYGWDTVLELRKVFASYNLEPIYVHHTHNEEPFEELCRKHDYVAVGSMDIKGDLSYMRRLLDTAEKHRTKVHLFGWTNPKLLPTFVKHRALYSVDSTNWMALSRFGTFPWFEGGKVKNLNKTQIMKKWGKKTKWDVGTAMAFGAIQWAKLGRWLETISRDYE